jgi:hypothetical protein
MYTVLGGHDPYMHVNRVAAMQAYTSFDHVLIINRWVVL